jgi:hypothetical protein
MKWLGVVVGKAFLLLLLGMEEVILGLTGIEKVGFGLTAMAQI